jgi:hypothetical protein
MANNVNITAPLIQNGSRIQLYNITKSVQLYNDEPTISESNTFSHTVDLDGTDVDAGNTIRMRVTCQASTTALLPLEVIGVINSAGLEFPQSQQDDTVYNSIGIDGSIFDSSTGGDNTTGLTMTPDDGTNILINLSDTVPPYQVTAQQIYSYFAYLQTTSTGITTFYNAITPVDGLNFRINASEVNLRIQNTGTNDINLMGGRLFRSDETSIIHTDSSQSYGTITHDTGFLLQFIQPQVEAALGNSVASATDMATVKSDVASIKSNPNLNLLTAFYTS